MRSLLVKILVVIIFVGFVFVLAKNTFFRTYGYCSMLNGCPTDKCERSTSCQSGGDGSELGCIAGSTSCEFKDSGLKWKYQEVSSEQAKKCIVNFASANGSLYPMMKYLEVKDQKNAESGICSQPIEGSIKYNNRDKFCWWYEMRHKDGDYHRFPFGVQITVGAQTCTVYLDPRSIQILKIDDPQLSLADINYTPQQAIACAESYISDHKSEYVEYKNYKQGSLVVPDNTAGSHAAVKDISKEWNFYTVTGGGVYLVVGAKTCSVYGVNEKYYTKI